MKPNKNLFQWDIKKFGFIKELSDYEIRPIPRSTKFDSNQMIDISDGVRIDLQFSDREKLLQTAIHDLKRFLEDCEISCNGNYPISIDKTTTECIGYSIEIADQSCRILTGDLENARRGLYHIQQMVLSNGGAWLTKGVIFRKPWIKNRISRCFFGPIKRPPFNRDELMDSVDYYPDAYLSRLAYEETYKKI